MVAVAAVEGCLKSVVLVCDALVDSLAFVEDE